MTDISLEALSLEELKKLQKDVTKAIEGFQDRQRQEALMAVEAKAREMGFSLVELTSGATRKAKPASPPKYRHPENPSVTWSGRGRQPDWIKEAVAAGASKDEFLIDK